MRANYVKLNVQVTPEQYKLLRLQAFYRGISIAQLVRDVIEDSSYLSNDKKGRGVKK